MDPPSPGDSPGNFKKLVNSLYKPTTALPVSFKSSFITNWPWISEDFFKKCTLPDSPDTTAVSKVPRLARDDSISTPMNSQEGKDVGNDRSECNNVNPTQPQQSTSKVSSTTLSEATQVSGSKGAITGKKKKKFQPHWQKKYSWINYNSVTNGMLC